MYITSYHMPISVVLYKRQIRTQDRNVKVVELHLTVYSFQLICLSDGAKRRSPCSILASSLLGCNGSDSIAEKTQQGVALHLILSI